VSKGRFVLYSIEPHIGEKYFILTIWEQMTASEVESIKQDSIDFLKRVDKRGWGLVTDIQDLKDSSREALLLLSDLMQELKRLGLKVVARIFKDRFSPTIKLWQEATVKAGVLTMYFTDRQKAISFVKERIRTL
jgi:hypothetical protein